MMNLSRYRTLSQVVNQLKDRGYSTDFKLEEGMLKSLKTGRTYLPENLRIMEQHRFEGESNPADMSVVFAIKTHDGIKGTVISSYGTYADIPLIKFMDQVAMADKAKVNG